MAEVFVQISIVIAIVFGVSLVMRFLKQPLIIGYIIGSIVGRIVKKVIERTKLEKWLEKTGRLDALCGIEPPKLLGSLVKWWIFIAFLTPATYYIQLGNLAGMIEDVARWLPLLLAAIIIMIVGLVVADFAANSISTAKKLKGIKLISPFARVLIIVYFLIWALDTIGLPVDLITNTLLILVGAIVLPLAIAMGIGFGFAFKKQAEKILINLEKKL